MHNPDSAKYNMITERHGADGSKGTNMTTNAAMSLPSTSSEVAGRVVAAAQGLGALVWWNLETTAVTPDALRGILASEGADPSIVPSIEAAGAIKRATREWRKGAGKADRYRAEIVRESSDEIVVGILRRAQVSRDEVEWRQIEDLRFDLVSGTWTTLGTLPESGDFRAIADEFRTHLDHAWIRPNIVVDGLRAASAVSLRSRGGVYYVPASHEAELDRLARILGRIGGCSLDVIHAQATPSSRASIASGASETLRSELGETIERIRSWREGAKRVYANAGATVISELADLASRASLYELALETSLGDLRAEIEAARKEAAEILES